MQLATTTSDFREVDTINERIEIINKCGFKYIDYSFGTDFQKKSGFFGDYDAHLKDIKTLADKLSIKFVQSHAPMGEPIIKNEKYEEFIEGNKVCIKACHDLGIPNIVVHSGYKKAFQKRSVLHVIRNFMSYSSPLPKNTMLKF